MTETTSSRPSDRQGRQRLERARASRQTRIRHRVAFFQNLGRRPEEIARLIGVPIDDVLNAASE